MTILSGDDKPLLACGKLLKEDNKFKYYLDDMSNNWIKSNTIKSLKNYIAYIVYNKETDSTTHLLVHNVKGKAIPIYENNKGCDFYDKITEFKAIAKHYKNYEDIIGE